VGVYQFVATEGFGSYRVWTPELAPPGAQQGALIVTGGQSVRGQFLPRPHLGCLHGIIHSPWCMAATVAASVAAPVAIHNADRASSYGLSGPVSP
jgi:hypothetical protein